MLAVELDLPAALPPAAVPFADDLTDSATPVAAVDAALNRLGRLDGVYANAGLLSQSPVAEVDDNAWDRLLAINLTAQFTIVRAAVPALESRPAGGIVLTSSEMVFSAARQMTAYIAAKSGVVGVVRAVAAELGVRANAIAPGPTDTPMMRAWLDAAPKPDAWWKSSCDGLRWADSPVRTTSRRRRRSLRRTTPSSSPGTPLVDDGGVTA